MNLHVFLLLIFNLIFIARSDNRDLSVRFNVDNNVKKTLDHNHVNNVNKISKLRLILISDLKKQNEVVVSNFFGGTNCWLL